MNVEKVKGTVASLSVCKPIAGAEKLRHDGLLSLSSALLFAC